MTHTLLLADDSVTIQRVIELTFADEDVQVVAVSDGDQAIARLESAPPDIVLADIGMPGKNGYEVAKYVKQSPKLSHIPVVLLTGAFEPVDQARAAEVGCDGVLAKPFEPQLVIGRVKELLATEAPATMAAAVQPMVPPVEASLGQGPSELDDYFDRLDVAFSKLQGGMAKSVADAERTETPVEALPAYVSEPPSSVAEEIDQYVAQHGDDPAPDLSLTPETPETLTPVAPPPPPPEPVTAPSPVLSAPAPGPTLEEVPAPPAVEPLLPAPVVNPVAARIKPAAAGSTPAGFPSIADAFAAILASESREPGTVRPVWPLFQPPAEPTPPAPLELTDEQLDRIVNIVLDRMSDRVVRETVSGVVGDTAERLVREEIERIKNAIK
jgi:CheY-like chemotaxis protein